MFATKNRRKNYIAMSTHFGKDAFSTLDCIVLCFGFCADANQRLGNKVELFRALSLPNLLYLEAEGSEDLRNLEDF